MDEQQQKNTPGVNGSEAPKTNISTDIIAQPEQSSKDFEEMVGGGGIG